MGNRAVITDERKKVGIYLHWNGGRDSIEGFLKYCKMKGYRNDDYGMARLAQTICNYFDDGLSCGVDLLENLDCDNWDNGMYIINTSTWEITGREYFNGVEQDRYTLSQMLKSINDCQPQKVRVCDNEIDEFLKKINTTLFWLYWNKNIKKLCQKGLTLGIKRCSIRVQVKDKTNQ